MRGPKANPTMYSEFGSTSLRLSLGILKYSAMASWAPDGSEEPKALLKMNRVPAVTMCSFLAWILVSYLDISNWKIPQ